MSRLKEVSQHIERWISSYNSSEVIAENIQDINKTLAMLYDLEAESAKTNQKLLKMMEHMTGMQVRI